MRPHLRLFALRRPVIAAATGSLLTTLLVVGAMALASNTAPGAILAAALAGVASAVLVGGTLGMLMRERVAALDGAAARISELAAACGLAEDHIRQDAMGESQAALLDRDITAIGRAYRSLHREREQSQNDLEQHIARQAEFYAQLSHELRSPLNAILGYTSLAIEDAEAGQGADLSQDLRKVRGAGHNLLALIDNLLQLAEDRTGRESVARAPFVLREVLAQIVSELATTAPDLRLEIAAGAGRETLFGNRTKVARAIGSVIDDAVRSGDARVISIATRTSATHDGSVEILLEVPHSTVSANETEALTRQLADRLASGVSGVLSVEAQGASGLIYVLRLPYDVDAAGKRLPPRQAAAEKEPSGDRKVGQKSALVIDDDSATIDLMSRWLERGGYSVRTATNAEHGLALAQEMAPDVVLLDALMPGRTGYDVLPDLTALPALRNTPVLLVTVDDDRPRGLAAGASDYVRKPVTEGRLREILAVYDSDLEGEVLIIEDERDAADLLERTVRRLGFSTRHAVDGAEGLAALGERTPAAILLDLNMPNLNGFEFIEAVARDETYAAIPLIVLSGQEISVDQHHRLLAAGVRYHMKGNAAPRDIAASLREMVA